MSAEFKSFKFRIYPNNEQRERIDFYLNINREFYNRLLEMSLNKFDSCGFAMTYSELSNYMDKLISEYKISGNEVRSSLIYTIKEVEKNIRFYKEGKTNRPNFKDDYNHYYACKFRNFNGCISVDEKINISSIKGVKYRSDLKISGSIINATISKTPADKYFVSILCKYPYIKNLSKTGLSIGIDVGYMNLATLSDNTVYNNEKEYLKLAEKLSYENKKLSRMTFRSKRFDKQRIKIARLHEKIKNRRSDNLHKMTTDIVEKYDEIYVETLDIDYMIQKSRSPEKILDASWQEMQRMLEYKSKWYNKKYVKISDTFKSSQKCSNCGYINEQVKDFTIKKWICPKCKTIHDRDLNAAINLLNQGKNK